MTHSILTRLGALAVTTAAVLALLALAPTGHGGSAGRVLAAAAPAPAAASNPWACVTLGRNLVGFASTANPWLAFNAARRVPGCGAFNANAICWTSRQWWGHGARAIVSFATWGRYSRC